MCTPQLINDTAQFVAEQRALDAGIHPDDARANGGQYGLLPRQPVVVPANIPAPSPSAMGAAGAGAMGAGAGSQIANAIANSGMLGNAGPKVQHMMHSQISSIPREVVAPIPQTSYAPMPYINPTVGDLLGNKYRNVEEVGGPGSFRNLNVPLR
jgi:hypothetical protein